MGLRQRLRHRAVVARRHPARHQSMLLAGKTVRRRRLRPLRPRRRHARARHGRATSSSPRSSRPTALKATLEGFTRHADGRGGASRRHLHHRHRHEGRHRRTPLRRHEGRRGRLQHRPLRLRDQPGRPRGMARKRKREMRANNEEYALEGRPPRLRAGRGTSGQSRRRRGPPVRGHGHVVRQPVPRACCKLAKDGKTLEKKVYELPPEQDQEIARIKLGTMGITIDTLTAEQAATRPTTPPGRRRRQEDARPGRSSRAIPEAPGPEDS